MSKAVSCLDADAIALPGTQPEGSANKSGITVATGTLVWKRDELNGTQVRDGWVHDAVVMNISTRPQAKGVLDLAYDWPRMFVSSLSKKERCQ